MSSQNRDREDTTIYKVVVNHEEQYSIWPADRENSPGWRDAGKSGTKQECLEYIKEVWTDMRPLSLRQRMEEAALDASSLPASAPDEPQQDDLVHRLSQGEHPVKIASQPGREADAFREAIQRGYLHLKFTGTHGGTNLGVRLNEDACNFSQADMERFTGNVHLEGSLNLDGVNVLCVADIDLSTLSGTGRLQKVD